MAQLFRPGADTIARVVLLAIVISPFTGVALAYALHLSPYATDQNLPLDQPVKFSHKHHVGDLGLDAATGCFRLSVANRATDQGRAKLAEIRIWIPSRWTYCSWW